MKNRNGYKIEKNKIKSIYQKNLLNTFLKVVKFCINHNEFSRIKTTRSWNDQKLHDTLINLRIKTKDKFSLIYDLMQKNIELNKFAISNKVQIIVSNFLGICSDEMMMTTQFRMDVPDDKRNTYDWHQDSAYDKLNKVPSNGAIVWMPMIDTNIKNGTLVIKPGSQVENNIYEIKQKWKKYVSPQLTVPKKYLKKYMTINVPVKSGDCIVMYPNLFHKSGTNTSNKVRFTVLARFNKILTKDFQIVQGRI